MVGLLSVFVSLVLLWGRWVYGHPNLIHHYGLTWQRQTFKNLGIGFLIGAASLFALFGAQGLLGWVSWQSVEPRERLRLLSVVLEGGVVAIAIGLGEEIVFRGWLLDELERDYRRAIALWGSSITFAVLHFIKPLDEIVRTFPQFPGLVILGLLLVWAKRSHWGNLGLPVGLHAGLVWGYYLIQVGQRVTYNPQAPELWAGIDQNPLAGGLGLIFLLGLAWGMLSLHRKAKRL